MIRRLKPIFWRYLFCLLAIACLAGAKDQPATRPASPRLTDLSGVVRHPLELGSSKAAVLLFIAVDCPVSNGYAPEINRICEAYEARHVSFYLVHADPDVTTEQASRHAKEFGYTCPVLIDREHELVKRVGATRTPEAIVIGQGGDILYRGRIDNLYVSLGKRRFEATLHDLRNALDAVLAGKPVENPRTSAVGCSIVD